MSQLYNGQLLVSIEEYVLSLTPIDGKTRSNKQTYNVLFFRDIISYNLTIEKQIMLIRKVSAMKDGSKRFFLGQHVQLDPR